MARETQEREGLIFQWPKGKKVPGGKLGGFVFLSFAGHAFAFYLFQVGYPPVERVEPLPDRVFVFNPAEPATQSLNREINDRLAFLRAPGESTDTRIEMRDFSSLFLFRPSFLDREVAFRSPPLPPVEAPEDAVPSLSEPLAFFPPVSKAGTLPVEEEMPTLQTIYWEIGGDLMRRKIQGVETLEKHLDGLVPETPLRLRVAVEASGAVRQVEPVTETSLPDIESILEAVTEYLRFEPVRAEGLTWGWFEIRS